MYDWSRKRFRTLSMTLLREVRIKYVLDVLITAWRDSILRITILKVLRVILRNKILLRYDQFFLSILLLIFFIGFEKGGREKDWYLLILWINYWKLKKGTDTQIDRHTDILIIGVSNWGYRSVINKLSSFFSGRARVPPRPRDFFFWSVRQGRGPYNKSFDFLIFVDDISTM